VRLQNWTAPRLPLTGGDLIDMGLDVGPQVAKMLQALERAWMEAGFPPEETTREMARQMIVASLRSAQ
jgi:poly(A) polymerase